MRRNNDGGTVFANWMVGQNMIPLAVHSLPRKNLPISTFIANNMWSSDLVQRNHKTWQNMRNWNKWTRLPRALNAVMPLVAPTHRKSYTVEEVHIPAGFMLRLSICMFRDLTQCIGAWCRSWNTTPPHHYGSSWTERQGVFGDVSSRQTSGSIGIGKVGKAKEWNRNWSISSLQS